MATKYIYLTGKAKWVKAHKMDEKYKNYTMNIYLDDASKQVFKESGLSIQPKQDEDGEFVTIRRPDVKQMKNELVKLGNPKVYNADNTEYTGVIGNGSEVTAKVCVYDTIKGPGHRWESVRVEKLVEYVPPKTDGTASNGGRPALPF